MKLLVAFLPLVLMISLSCSIDTGEDNTIIYSVTLKKITGGLEAPIGMAAPDDNSGRLFVIEQRGIIKIIKNGQLIVQPFLNIENKLAKVSEGYSEKGLLGITFHPDFKNNGRLYVYYSAPTHTKGMDHKSRIASYTASSNPDVANTAEQIILEIDEPESNHNGGQICFGPDGYLYIGVGDGGGAGDKHNVNGNGQNLNSLLGKILRIDVNNSSAYKIPPDNPFVNKDGADEIFAYGFRNPWRFSFDFKTESLFCADVGQNEYEEVDLVEKGRNYGWRIMEGTHCYNPSTGCQTAGLTFPIDEYSHAEGKSVIGGYVYRGTSSPDMQGNYFFGDWTGKIFMLLKSSASNHWERRVMTVKGVEGDFYINSFGEGADKTLYVMGQPSIGTQRSGMLYQLVFE
ncbi:MAG: PQQ-dependent sugar dehydrogenase [Chitinophagaceae bacterium]|nr:PQQ-dependent sugar dehydrogenase [Chitinophagaceae bacterium]